MNGLIELFAITFSLVALITAIAALAMVIGMKLSTHRIEWKPLDLEAEVASPEEIIAEEEDEDLLAKALELQKKKKKQEDPLDSIAETSNF